MKKVLLLLLIPTTAFAAWLISQDEQPDTGQRGPHGGVMKASGVYYIELKSTPTALYSYLYDAHHMAVPNGKTLCQARLIYADSNMTKVNMIPFGIDGFYGELKTDLYDYAVVMYRYNNEFIVAQFENTRLVVCTENDAQTDL